MMPALPGLREALDLLQPRTLCRSLLRGSWVLLRLSARLLLAGLRRATSPAAAPPARKGPPAKADVRKTDVPPDAEEGESAPARKPTTGNAAAAARAGGDHLQQAGISLLVCLVAGAALSSIGGILRHLLSPYMPVLTAALVVTWFAAALTADAITHPKDDHDAGEEPTEAQPEPAPEETPDGQEEDVEEDQEEDQEEDAAPWPAQEKLLVKFVEQRVAATAGGHTENVKGRGARIIDLLTEQQANGGLIGLDQKALTDLLEKAGITVREQMKFRVLTPTPNGTKWVQKNNPGVHIEDLSKYLGRTPHLPPHLVADNTPGRPPVPALVAVPDPAPETPPIPLQRAAGE